MLNTGWFIVDLNALKLTITRCVQAVSVALKRSMKNAETLFDCMDLVWSLSINPESRVDLMKICGSLIFDAILSWPDEEDLAVVCLAVMVNLAYNEKNKSSLMSLGAPDVIWHLLKKFKENTSLIHRVTVLLKLLSKGSSKNKKIMCSKGVDIFTDVVNFYADKSNSALKQLVALAEKETDATAKQEREQERERIVTRLGLSNEVLKEFGELGRELGRTSLF